MFWAHVHFASYSLCTGSLLAGPVLTPKKALSDNELSTVFTFPYRHCVTESCSGVLPSLQCPIDVAQFVLTLQSALISTATGPISMKCGIGGT
jgi:hypothetical protein